MAEGVIGAIGRERAGRPGTVGNIVDGIVEDSEHAELILVVDVGVRKHEALHGAVAVDVEAELIFAEVADDLAAAVVLDAVRVVVPAAQ